jgi:hypothetical protein
MQNSQQIALFLRPTFPQVSRLKFTIQILYRLPTSSDIKQKNYGLFNYFNRTPATLKGYVNIKLLSIQHLNNKRIFFILFFSVEKEHCEMTMNFCCVLLFRL